jgi:hypothetical protein
VSYKECFKEIEDEMKHLYALNLKQAIMIKRRDTVINSIFKDSCESAKGTVLNNVKAKIMRHLKDVSKGK